MILPRFEMIREGHINPNLTARENEECEQCIQRVNRTRSKFNQLIDCLERFINFIFHKRT